MIESPYRFFAFPSWRDDDEYVSCWERHIPDEGNGDGTSYTDHYLHGFNAPGNGWGSGGSIFAAYWWEKTTHARGDGFPLGEQSPPHSSRR